jgi:hypothetical protein
MLFHECVDWAHECMTLEELLLCQLFILKFSSYKNLNKVSKYKTKK